MIYRKLIRPVLFQFDAEGVHHLAMSGLRVGFGLPGARAVARRACTAKDARLCQTLWGVDFPNPVGLAAGFDKNARYIRELSALGFGALEIGTVTGQPQTGNPRPRLFRLTADLGLLNRMGFNNDGSEAVAAQLRKHGFQRHDSATVLGVNIGKTKIVALEDAPADYALSFRRLFDFAQYFVVNVSSPNTPGLRALQEKEPLAELLGRLQALNEELAAQKNDGRRPILLKIAPDLSDAQLDDILEVIEACAIDGIIATNTTIEREGLRTPGQADLGRGGVSGRALRPRALAIISQIYRKTHGRLPIIGVGGLFTPADALQTIRAGASLVQVWTGFVYEGPLCVRRINQGLLGACEAHGWKNISEAIGLDA